MDREEAAGERALLEIASNLFSEFLRNKDYLLSRSFKSVRDPKVKVDPPRRTG